MLRKPYKLPDLAEALQSALASAPAALRAAG